MKPVILAINRLIPRSRTEPTVDRVATWLAARGIPVMHVENGSGRWEDLAAARASDADLAVALGGDGTVLASSRMFADLGVPILGVRLGKLGFLSEVEPPVVVGALEKWADGNFWIESRLMLELCVVRDGETVYTGCCLNDVVLSRGATLRAVEVAFEIDGQPVAGYAGDGLIIATPTGSTAYSLSAGGPILVPELQAILVTPLCAHSLWLRPCVVSPNSTIRMYLTREAMHSVVVLDGQESFSVYAGDELCVRRAHYACRLVRIKQFNYFRVLSRKLQGETGG
ncbi:MAG: NAD(+)/NADH kinase [Candidatus Desulforudis sp.]|nr:NAD(+)/NADH kinase [Desulforudis sp.]